MKLSDAAVMGSMITEMCRGSWSGCFLAAAARAVGISDWETDKKTSRLVRDIRKYWPWLTELYEEVNPFRDHLGFIIDSYDRLDSSAMNFEQLVVHVRSIEPDCGTCNRFRCTCVGLRIEEVPAAVQKPAVFVDQWANETVE